MHRLSREELEELFLPYTQHFHDALYAGCIAAGEANLQRVLSADKRALFSHIVRSAAYEYLRANPLEDFTLDEKAHRKNQAIWMKHKETRIDVRIMRLTAFRSSIDTPITGIADDPAIAQAIAQLDLQFQSPGVVAISWETPTFKNNEPEGEIPLTLVRAADGTNIRDGRADAIIPLYGHSPIFTKYLIPDSSFIPDLADSKITFENEDVQER